MSRNWMSTPCPAPAAQPLHHLDLFSPVKYDDNDTTATADIDYTRAILQREFQSARARRPPGRGRKGAAVDAVTIFEDIFESEEPALKRDIGRVEGKGALLGRPAQRGRLGDIGQARRWNGITSKVPETVEDGPPVLEVEDKKSVGPKRDMRRRTIFVPSDDTTMLTIHPGANATSKIDDTFQFPAFAPQSVASPAQPARALNNFQGHIQAKRPRMSLAVAPKRIPLQQTETKSNNVPSIDIAGQNGGKENFPPKHERVGSKSTSLCLKAAQGKSPVVAKSSLFEPTRASQSKQTVVARKAVPLVQAKAARNVDVTKGLKLNKPVGSAVGRSAAVRDSPVMEARKTTAVRKNGPTSVIHNASQLTSNTSRPRSTNFVSSIEAAKAKLHRYPVLSEDVSQPALYEDDWPAQQEVALTEVINQIFAGAEEAGPWDAVNEAESLRGNLMMIYHQPAVTTLYEHLQASLLCGALSHPKDAPSHSPDLTRDLGLRKRFLGLWLNSYELGHLQAAVEVVVGRRSATPELSPAQSLQASESILDPHKKRRTLIAFLDTFLISVDDAVDGTADGQGETARRQNKTIVRSLMLIWLLDQSQLSRTTKGCLFKNTAAHKSSVSVLQTLAAMLMPSVGDVVRALRYMDYAVQHIQDPLDEVVYHIDNLAVDLRDGVQLTRLVELLHYTGSSASSGACERNFDEPTVTIIMPDSTILESEFAASRDTRSPRILSQHLKMPCLGRAQRLFNVQVALSSLACDSETADIVSGNITAEDIVDGHREKTLRLLWSLVSSIGLDKLLDWKELEADTKRMCSAASGRQDRDYESRLQDWAAAYCAHEGLPVSNLTTSFGDGRAYSCIVRSFSDFFATKSNTNHRPTQTSTLDAQLHSLNCSQPFIRQLTSRSSKIPHRVTTIANLAFLASRLLPLARENRAAVLIQRAYRHRRAGVVLKQRVILMRLARDCAVVAQSKQKVAEAVVTVQRAWRRVVEARELKLMTDVEVFQMMARGWACRRRVISKRTENAGLSRRVMGGW